MKWEIGELVRHCKLSDEHFANVWEQSGPHGPWRAAVENEDGEWIWSGARFETEHAAQSAVVHWIGKTMAQFSNALAAGEQREVDEE